MKESTPPRPPSGAANLHLLMVLSVAVAIASIGWAIALVDLEGRLILLAVLLLLPSVIAVIPLLRRSRRGNQGRVEPRHDARPTAPPPDLLAEWLAANAGQQNQRKERNR